MVSATRWREYPFAIKTNQKQNMILAMKNWIEENENDDLQNLLSASPFELWHTSSSSELSIIALSDKWSLYSSCLLYENVPLPRRLGVWTLVSVNESSDTSGKHCDKRNSSGVRSAIASQSVNFHKIVYNIINELQKQVTWNQQDMSMIKPYPICKEGPLPKSDSFHGN